MSGPTASEPLTMVGILRAYGDLQKALLRDALGDRLIGSRFVHRGEAIAVAADGYRPDDSLEGVELAADLLQNGGTLVVSADWLDE